MQRDIVLASQVLSELPSDSARRTATTVLWDLVKEGGVLVVRFGCELNGC